MRILLVHNYYGSSAPSGENQAFALERSMLESRGHKVRVHERFSDEIRARGILGAAQGAWATPWNPWAARAVRMQVSAFQPHLVHVHNSFPLISPAIFPAIGLAAARVLTLHNYRLFCSAGIPIRNGHVCTECLDNRSVAPALRYGCYRGSRAATLPLAASISLHRRRGTWERDVEAFIALTEFQRHMVTEAGLPEGRVHVKPNFFPGNPLPVRWEERRQRAVFVGRLSVEKGVGDLVSAWLAWGRVAPELVLVGDGPLRFELEAQAASSEFRRVIFTGNVDSHKAQRAIAEARLLILPSICFEGFPMVMREALAFGTPCAVSNIGPLPELVARGSAGITFHPGDPEDLLVKVRELWSDQARLQRMGKRAREEFEAHYTEDANYERLMQIYEEAIAVQRARRVGS